MGIQDYVALAMTGVAVWVVVRFTWRSFRGGGCSCDPSAASDDAAPCAKATVRSGFQQTPMVPIDEVGVVHSRSGGRPKH